MRSFEQIAEYEGHSGWCACLAILPLAPDLAVSGGSDKLLHAWHLSTGHMVHKLASHGHSISCLAASAQQPLLASGDRSAIVMLWSTETWQCLWRLGFFGDLIRAVAFSPSGEQLLVSFGRFNAPTDTVLLSTRDSKQLRRYPMFPGEVVDTSFWPEKQLFASVKPCMPD
eukprot:m.900379 g.900379  ORF g.900379 m.900379 type:complete len:170 (+) comp60043_c0_seq3:612-1121(+)